MEPLTSVSFCSDVANWQHERWHLAICYCTMAITKVS